MNNVNRSGNECAAISPILLFTYARAISQSTRVPAATALTRHAAVRDPALGPSAYGVVHRHWQPTYLATDVHRVLT